MNNNPFCGKATYTKPPDNYPESDRQKITECIELLVINGISVKTKGRVHQKFAVY